MICGDVLLGIAVTSGEGLRDITAGCLGNTSGTAFREVAAIVTESEISRVFFLRKRIVCVVSRGFAITVSSCNGKPRIGTLKVVTRGVEYQRLCRYSLLERLRGYYPLNILPRLTGLSSYISRCQWVVSLQSALPVGTQELPARGTPRASTLHRICADESLQKEGNDHRLQ